MAKVESRLWGQSGRSATGAAAWRQLGERFVLAGLFAMAVLGNLAQATPAPRVLLVMGDSLSAAFGLSADQGWVALLGNRVASQAPGWRVVNASVSGETTAGGVARIDAELALHKPGLVVIELGANDALRGLPLDLAKANLARMIAASRAAGARVLLIGMQIPPNYGPEYTEQFRAMYQALAAPPEVTLLPFLLEPIALDRAAYQADNLHPVAAAQPALLDHVWPAVLPHLGKP